MSINAVPIPMPTASDPAARCSISLRAERVSGADWDAALIGFDEVCQEQLYAFAKIRWPRVVCEPTLFYRGGQLVGGALIMIQSVALARIAVIKWGPMLADADQPDGEAVRAAMVEMVLAQYSAERRMMVSILPAASIAPLNAAYVNLRRRGFSRGSALLFPNRYLVRLRDEDAQLRKNLHQKWRYHLSKAEKLPLRFCRAVNQDAGTPDIAAFKTLYAAMSARKQFPDHSAFGTIDTLMGLEEALRPELFFVYLNETRVAGALIFKAGKRAVYLYGATNDDALPARAGYFLHWHIIRWLRDNTRAEWYDLGGTDGFRGLHQFKKGMVGEGGLIRPVPPVTNFAHHVLPRFFGATAFLARDAMQHGLRHLNALRRDQARPDQAPHIWEDYLK